MVNRERTAGTSKRQQSQSQYPPAGSGDRAVIHRLPQAEHPYPWLMFSHNKGYKRQTFCTLTKHGAETHRRTIPELRDKTVQASSDGWLVLSDNKDQQRYSLWNLSTLDSIVLPPIKPRHKFVPGSCVFLSKPPGGTVVLFEANRPLLLFLRIGTAQEAWSEIRLEKQGLKHMGIVDEIHSFDLTASCDGVIYVTTPNSYGKLFTIDVDDTKRIVKSLNMNLPRGERYSPISSTRSVEYGGDLFTIKIFIGGINWNEVIAIEVYRMNLSAKVWEKIQSSKGVVFFLEETYGGVSCATAAPSALESSLIYFTRNADKKVYRYNIAERSLSAAFCFPKLPLHCSAPAWILPSYKLVDNQKKSEDDETGSEEKEEDVKTKLNCGNDVEDQGEMNLLHLPREILEKIAGGLILLDYMNFRAACRECLLAAPAIEWRKASPRAHSLSPWLVFTAKDRKVLDLIEPEHGGRYFINIPTELEDATIHYSKDGWLLMSRDQESFFFFFNPFTKVVVAWPYLNPPVEHVFGFLFTSVPTSSDCLVIGISGFGAYYSNSSSTEWDYEELIDGAKFVPNHQVPVLYNGACYIMCHKGNLGVLTSDEEGHLTWEVLDKLQVPCNSFHQSCLVECEDELLSVFIGDFGKWLRVFRLHPSNLVWEEVNSLGNKAVFLSRSSAFSVVAKTKKMENKIYLPRVHKGSSVFYSLETRMFHSFRGDSFADYADTVEQLLCGWIEPSWI